MSGQEPTTDERLRARMTEMRAEIASSPEAQEQLQRMTSEHIATITGNAAAAGSSGAAALEGTVLGNAADSSTTPLLSLHRNPDLTPTLTVVNYPHLAQALAVQVPATQDTYTLRASTSTNVFLDSTVALIAVAPQKVVMVAQPGWSIILIVTSDDTYSPVVVPNSSLLRVPVASGSGQGVNNNAQPQPQPQPQASGSGGVGAETASGREDSLHPEDGTTGGGPASGGATAAHTEDVVEVPEGGALTAIHPENDDEEEGL
ncbi:uncharacterized protein BDZ99DRAFT_515179 [Mytilinidion resinicola]|uniref:Uncharacterized protein n=1 Tax=Mytilinidion resinicola TaxID=574789 RepID=A0A6A6Z8I5_9PEZI|nr:uncharacterized protein BDZ99DRAFT_515179 [Mytilinidion resinicola]KAF2816595.1 hypothetical protein BDZ99DRAFT_515179 [Mytilinidion resinicola]